MDEDVRCCMKHGWYKWKELTGILCDKNIPSKLKSKVYKTRISPAMMECWPMRKSELPLDTAEMNLLKWILGKKRADRLCSEMV